MIGIGSNFILFPAFFKYVFTRNKLDSIGSHLNIVCPVESKCVFHVI